MTTISIALATYNGARFLSAQLETLARQTRPPDELIVADDGSTDETLAIVRDFARRAPFSVIVLPMGARLGYRANFMRCAEACNGDLIAFCDQDDLWDIDKLEAVERAIAPGTLLLQHDFRVIDPEGLPLAGDMDSLGLSESEPGARVLGLVQVFRRSLLRFWPLWTASIDQNAPTERMAHDQWVYFLAQTMRSVQLLRRPLLGYRQHGANTCGMEPQGLDGATLRPAALIGELLRGRSEIRQLKRDITLAGLVCSEAAARGRAAVLSEMNECVGDARQRELTRRASRDNAVLASYCRYRIASYRAGSRRMLYGALLRSRKDYMARGARGLKDLVLDLALNT